MRTSQAKKTTRTKPAARSEINLAWIAKHLRVPDGPKLGQPLVLDPWQADIMRGIYDTPTRTVIVSMGRKNGKTSFSAALLLLHLCGPEARPNSELYSSALSRDQAALIFRLASKMIRLSPSLRDFVHIRDTNKQLFVPDLGTQYAALSADASTNFGLSPVFTVHDELGQVQGERHPLYEALETATGAQQNPLSVIISTQAPTDNDLLSRLIDDAQGPQSDPTTKLFFYTADPEADPFSDKTIMQANPAFKTFQNRVEVRRMARDAKRMPSREASYRNLILNQRVEASSPFVQPSDWTKNNGKPHDLDGDVWGGLDLSKTTDLTALVLLSLRGGVWQVHPIFWVPAEGIEDKSRCDRVPYDLWAKAGLVRTTPGRAVEYKFVARDIAKIFAEHDVRSIAFDRWGMQHLKPWLVEAGLSDTIINERFVPFGQGYQSMTPALNVLETMLTNGRMRHGNHPVLSFCAANAVVKTDETDGRKLDKKRSRGRIDGMVALAMAASEADKEQVGRKVYPVAEDHIMEDLHG